MDPLNPAPQENAPERLVIVGDGAVAAALAAIASVLGWQPMITDSAAGAEAASLDLRACDSVAVLSHDEGVEGPALAAALASAAGHIAAMGSRRTQARRRQWLQDHGVADGLIDSVRGPAGLDIGADTPAEIAVSIAAEIIAERRGAAGATALSRRSGPIHPNPTPAPADCPAG